MSALLGGNVLLALGPWSTRLADCGPVSAGFWRLALALPVLLALAWREGGCPSLTARQFGLLAFAGVIFAADLVCWQLGIPRTRLANATLFGNCSSILLIIWALVAARRWPSWGEALAVVAMAGGAAILLGRSAGVSTETLTGDLLCIAAGAFYTVYLIAVRNAQAGADAVSGPVALGVASVVATPVMLAAALALGEPLWPGASRLTQGWGAAVHGGWVPLVLLALGSQVLGQGMLVRALRLVSPLVIGLSLMVQPAVAVLLGWAAFGEVLTGRDALGVTLVAAALVVAQARN